MKNDFLPYKVGTVFNPISNACNASRKYSLVQIEYPSRLNAMAIDPALITSNKNMIYTPGEVVLAVNLPRFVKVQITPADKEIKISDRSPRPSLIKHAALLMKEALNFQDGILIDMYAPHEIQHAGLGTSSCTIASVCAAINELYGNPIKNSDLLKYTAQNHGEEINDNDDFLMPVQCIGGGAAAGLCSDSILIITGKSTVVCSTTCDLPIIIGIPSDYIPLDSAALMQKEIENLHKFLNTGEKYRGNIAYKMLHDVLPGLVNNDISKLGDLVYEYRFDMGSIDNCSFVYPPMSAIKENLRILKTKNIVDLLALSSVGPAFFAITRNPEECKKIFEENGLRCIETTFYNKTYNVLEKVL